MSDNVHSPSHYKLPNGMEMIDIIRLLLTPEEFRGYCKGNVLKYNGRSGKKDDPAQEAGKAAVYAQWLAESYEEPKIEPTVFNGWATQPAPVVDEPCVLSADKASYFTDLVWEDNEGDTWEFKDGLWTCSAVAYGKDSLSVAYEPYTLKEHKVEGA